jgi:chromosome segregation ATPase
VRKRKTKKRLSTTKTFSPSYQLLKRRKTKQKENYNRQINNLQQKITNLLGQRGNLTNELTDLETTAQTYYQTSQQNLADTRQELRDTRQELENAQQVQTQAEGRLTYYQTQDEALRNTIINLQTQLTNQQNLNQTLQNQINNHTCPTLTPHVCSPCALIHSPEPHICPIIQETNCSHSDYQNNSTQSRIRFRFR